MTRITHFLTLVGLAALLACQPTEPARPTVSVTPRNVPAAATATAVPPTVGPTADIAAAVPEDHLSAFGAGLVAGEQNLLTEFADLSIYELDLTISDDLSAVSGSEAVRYTNTEAEGLNEVQFRLYPNILGGRMTVRLLTVDDQEAEPSYGMDDSLMTVPLPAALAPGEGVLIEMEFEVSVPSGLDENYGVLSRAGGVLSLAHAYPVIAMYQEGEWTTGMPSPWGDITVADAAYYLARISAPEKLHIAASGTELGRETDGDSQILTVAAGPARDFYLAAGRDYLVREEQWGEVTVRVFSPAGTSPRAELSLTVAREALEVFSARYGAYPYTELEIAATPTQILGIEFPGLIVLTAGLLSPAEDMPSEPEEAWLISTLAHEVAHQWFYNLVGNDQLDEPWLDESLAQFATWEYFADARGAAAADGFATTLEGRWGRVDNEPIPVGKPVASYSAREYGAIVYGRGALFFDELRGVMGQQSFDAFLKDYVHTYRWSLAKTEGMQAMAEEHCSCELSGLFDEWILP
jgi:hypothetical protein